MLSRAEPQSAEGRTLSLKPNWQLDHKAKPGAVVGGQDGRAQGLCHAGPAQVGRARDPIIKMDRLAQERVCVSVCVCVCGKRERERETSLGEERVAEHAAEEKKNCMQPFQNELSFFCCSSRSVAPPRSEFGERSLTVGADTSRWPPPI